MTNNWSTNADEVQSYKIFFCGWCEWLRAVIMARICVVIHRETVSWQCWSTSFRITNRAIRHSRPMACLPRNSSSSSYHHCRHHSRTTSYVKHVKTTMEQDKTLQDHRTPTVLLTTRSSSFTHYELREACQDDNGTGQDPARPQNSNGITDNTVVIIHALRATWSMSRRQWNRTRPCKTTELQRYYWQQHVAYISQSLR